MLEQKDLDAIRGIMKEEINTSEGMLLDEMDRMQTNLEKQISQIQKNLEELNQHYRIDKMENENTGILLKMISDLQKRVEALEEKTA